MTERGQITIPKAIRDKCGFTPNIEVEVKLKNGVVVVKPKRDMKKFDAAIKKWQGAGAKRLKELGFNSTDVLIDAIRVR